MSIMTAIPISISNITAQVPIMKEALYVVKTKNSRMFWVDLRRRAQIANV